MYLYVEAHPGACVSGGPQPQRLFSGPWSPAGEPSAHPQKGLSLHACLSQPAVSPYPSVFRHVCFSTRWSLSTCLSVCLSQPAVTLYLCLFLDVCLSQPTSVSLPVRLFPHVFSLNLLVTLYLTVSL